MVPRVQWSSFPLGFHEQRLAFRRNRDRRNGAVIPLDVAMQFPEMAATPSNFFKAIGSQLSANAPAPQSFLRSVSHQHLLSLSQQTDVYVVHASME